MNRLLLPLVMLVLGTAMARAESPTVELNEPLARKCLDHALLCLASYDSDGDAEVIGWDGPNNRYGGYNLNDDFLGLHAAVYKRTNKSGEREAVMAFRGTDEPIDWVMNLQNYVGLVPDAYVQAATFAQAASALAKGERIESFSFTGHSLGGGLANYCALLFNRGATCFGSAAIGSGLQKILWNETSGHAFDPSRIVHVIKQDDLVPVLTDRTGKHYGTIALPKLNSPKDYAKNKSIEEKLTYFAISGFVTRKWLRSGKEVAMSEIMEGHGIDQYIAALANLINPPGRFSPDGEWVSKGSFFDVSSNEARFRFCRNGSFKVINDLKFFEIVRQRTNDSGTWDYHPPDLNMTIPGLARMNYRLTKGDGDQVAVWTRVSMKPDMPPPGQNATPSEQLTAATLELIFRRMEGKTIDWQRISPTPD